MTGVLIHFSNSCKNDKRNSNLFFNNKQCKNEIQIHFSKLSENEKQNAKFKSVFQCHAKTKNVNGIWIPFSHAIEKRLALRYTHLLASRTWNFTRKPRKQKYEIRSISEYYVTITRPAVWKRNTPHAVSNTNKGKKVKFIVQISFAEKNWSGSDRALPKHPFFNGRLSWCSIGAAMQLNKGKKNLCRNGLKFSIAWGELKISRWPLHSFKIFESYLINSLRFSTV